MRVNLGMSQTGIFRFGSRNNDRAVQNTNKGSSWMNASNGKNGTESAAAMRKLLREIGQTDQNGACQNTSPFSSAVNNSTSYANSLREARAKKKNTSLQLKRLFYNFKSISTQIMRSKTSLSAKQVAGKARREVIRLRRQRGSGNYKDAELQSAIVHAQAMERVAKKKVRHLLEEELMKVADGPGVEKLEEKQGEEGENTERVVETTVTAEQTMVAAASDSFVHESLTVVTDEQEELSQEQLQAFQDAMRAQTEDLQRMMQMQMEEMQRAMEEMTAELRMNMEDMMSGLMDEISEMMKEMLEESGLEDLADSMFTTAGMEMDLADYKMMKIKHRSEEMREIAEADAEYLKALFDRLEKSKNSSIQGNFGSNNNNNTSVSYAGSPAGGAVPVSSAPVQAIDIVSTPDAVAAVSTAMPVAGGSIDVSL